MFFGMFHVSTASSGNRSDVSTWSIMTRVAARSFTALPT